MAWQKTWIFNKQWEENPYHPLSPNIYRNWIIEFYFNIKQWGIKFHIEYDGDSFMHGYEANFQIMIGPFHFLINWERYCDEDSLL